MKKYFIAAVVGLMAFSMAAFAASLNVDGGTLQAGEDTELECVDDVNVQAWGYNDYTGKVLNVTLKAENNACDGEFMYLTLLDNNGQRLTGHGHNSQAFVVTDFGDKDDNAFSIDLTRGDNSAGAGIDASAIGGIRVGVDQGY